MEEISTGVSPSASLQPAIGSRMRDINKASWNLREARPTKYGFDLCFGTPRDTYRVPYAGPNQIIVTKALRGFWYANRTKKLRFFFDLPAGSSSIQQTLRRLRFNHRADVQAFWTERVEDLASLPTRAFAAKHGVEPAAAFAWRLKLVKRGRPKGWWRTPEFLKVLFSPMSLSEAGRELGVPMSEVNRLRRLAKRELK